MSLFSSMKNLYRKIMGREGEIRLTDDSGTVINKEDYDTIKNYINGNIANIIYKKIKSREKLTDLEIELAHTSLGFTRYKTSLFRITDYLLEDAVLVLDKASIIVSENDRGEKFISDIVYEFKDFLHDDTSNKHAITITMSIKDTELYLKPFEPNHPVKEGKNHVS